jgi:hypothetical protein
MNCTEECGGGGGSFAGVGDSSALAVVWQSPNRNKRMAMRKCVFKSVFFGVFLDGAGSIFHSPVAVCVRIGI